jgi:chitin synthase
MKMTPPVKSATPYGGRLTWKLPGGNLLIVHLKDKKKVVKRKRWSMVNNYFKKFLAIC